MQLELITLCENTAGAAFVTAEWGLSVFVRTEGVNVLFDTGGGLSLTRNVGRLGVDLRTAEYIVLSHGHFDHTGGLRDALLQTGPKPVIAHPAVWGLKYARISPSHSPQYIGVPFRHEELESLGAQFRYSREPVELSDAVLTTGEIPLDDPASTIEPALLVEEDGELKQDTMPDDQALIVKTPQGLVVILGCAHRGMIPTLRHAQAITGEQRIHTVIGGTHLYPKTPEELNEVGAELLAMDVKRIGVSHCTGLPAAARLGQILGDRFFANNAGNVVRLNL